jgi:hypothetical protein
MIRAADILAVIEGSEGTKPKKIVSDLMALYPHTDFKKAVSQTATKYKSTPLTVLNLYMKHTGTTFNNLPDGYTMKSFGKPGKSAPGGENGDSSYNSSDNYGDEGDYADYADETGDETDTGEEPEDDEDKEDVDFSFLK